MKIPTLSERMKAITDLVSRGKSVCDVGCDHGYVSIYLVLEKQVPRAIAMDVRLGPLSLAREHISEYGLADKIETRCSDGLEKLEIGETQSVVIAGMGGVLMEKILTEGQDKAKAFEELILQPQSQIPEFRAFLRNNGYRVVSENMILEEGKFYPMMKVIPGEGICEYENKEDTYLYDCFGEYLLKERNEVLKQYLLKMHKTNEELKLHLLANPGEKTQAREITLQKEQDGIEEALAKYYSLYL